MALLTFPPRWRLAQLQHRVIVLAADADTSRAANNREACYQNAPNDGDTDKKPRHAPESHHFSPGTLGFAITYHSPHTRRERHLFPRVSRNAHDGASFRRRCEYIFHSSPFVKLRRGTRRRTPCLQGKCFKAKKQGRSPEGAALFSWFRLTLEPVLDDQREDAGLESVRRRRQVAAAGQSAPSQLRLSHTPWTCIQPPGTLYTTATPLLVLPGPTNRHP